MGQKYFTYIQNDYRFVFPIDYSADELCQNWHANARTLKKYLSEHSLLTDTLAQLVITDENVKQRSIKKIPLPVEAERFMYCFFSLATQRQFKSLFMGAEDDAQLENFSSKLCEKLATEVLPPENDDSPDMNAFCRHILFKNDSLNTIIMKRQWEEQINLRIERIRELAEQVSVSRQASLLRQCLQQLDKILFDLNDQVDISLQRGKTPPLPQELLEALLSKRIERRKNLPGEDYISYKVKNLDVELNSDGINEVKKLKEVFSELSIASSRKEAWLKQARIAYLCDLAAEVSPSDFELKYLELIEYLNLSSGKIDKKIIDTKIVNTVKRVCIQELLNCCDPVVHNGNSLIPLIKSFEDTYIYDFLKGMSHRKFRKFGLYAKRTEELLNTAKTSYQFWKRWLDENAMSPEKEFTTKDVVCRIECIRTVIEPFNKLFADIWAGLYGPGVVSLMDDWPKYEGKFRQKFRENGLFAADYFGMRKEFDKRIAQLHNDALGCNDIEIVALCDINIALLEGCFQILYYAVKDIVESAETGLKFFQQCQRSVQN